MRVLYGGDFATPYQRKMEEELHAKLVEEFNLRTVHPKYSRSCQTCGKTFVGGDWRLLEKPFCSKECELAAYKEIYFADKYRIELFWRDFGKYFYLLEDYLFMNCPFMYELPLPVKKDKFGWSVAHYDERQWFLKLQEEIFEAFNATSNQERAQELTDVITVCASYLHALGFDHNARAELQRAVNEKNAVRGYFKE